MLFTWLPDAIRQSALVEPESIIAIAMSDKDRQTNYKRAPTGICLAAIFVYGLCPWVSVSLNKHIVKFFSTSHACFCNPKTILLLLKDV
jgi:hypothetical protein